LPSIICAPPVATHSSLVSSCLVVLSGILPTFIFRNSHSFRL
jgi:hypothetical protein